MKYIVKIITLSFMIFLLAACSEPTLDASSEEAMKESIQVIVDTLPEGKKKEFKEALRGIYMLGAMSSVRTNKSKAEILELVLAKLDGRTADDVFALVEEIKSEMKR